jgi:hypothetical protein
MPKSNSRNYGDKESRRRRALERFGTDNPKCILTGEENPVALQLHHVAGHRFDDVVVPISLTVHAKASDLQKDHPSKIEGCKNPLERVGHLCLGLGDLVEVALDDLRDPILAAFLAWLRMKLKEIGLILIEFARQAPTMEFYFTP